jgi:hypothetical protein
MKFSSVWNTQKILVNEKKKNKGLTIKKNKTRKKKNPLEILFFRYKIRAQIVLPIIPLYSFLCLSNIKKSKKI